MQKYFGKNVDFSGCEILVKCGSRYPDLNDNNHYKCWRDGQIVSISPLGYHTGNYVGYCRTLIKLPNISYKSLGGKTEQNFKNPNITFIDKVLSTTDYRGKYKWELPKGSRPKKKRKSRDYFIDFKDLENKDNITIGDYERIYDFNKKSIITLSESNIKNIINHEENSSRISTEADTKHASITSGTYSIGSGLDYDNLVDFESAIGATQTGDLKAELADESIPHETTVYFGHDTSDYNFTITAAAGAAHSGFYGNETHQVGDGARLAYSNFRDIYFSEDSAGTLNNIEVSYIVFDATGNGIDSLTADDCCDSGVFLLKNNIFRGNLDSDYGIYVITNAVGNAQVRNNIVYGYTEIDAAGIGFNASVGSNNLEVYNNTVAKCYHGIAQEYASEAGEPTKTFKNNLVQDCTSGCYYDAGGGFGTTSKNISEDDTSPDTSYRGYQLHP